MDDRLWSPNLESTIPLQVGTELRIPYQLSPAVQENLVQEIVLRVKTVSTTNWLGNLTTTNFKNGVAYFLLDTSSPENLNTTKKVLRVSETTPKEEVDKLVKKFTRIGQYYKVQIACTSKGPDETFTDRLGYFSNVGIYKYSTEPILSILEERAGSYQCIGSYSQKKQDKTEKIYKYCFNLYEMIPNQIDPQQKIKTFIGTSEWQVHDSSKDDTTGISKDYWHFNSMSDDTVEHELVLEYLVLSLNGYEGKCEKNFIQSSNTELLKNVLFSVNNNYDEGYIQIQVQNQVATERKFYLYRKKKGEKISYKISNEIILSEKQTYNFKDFTTEQGFEYEYSLQEILPNMTYSKALKKNVKSDFEDMFLFDGKKQLKIRFNPQVSSFKTVLSETKVMTIGSKYPFIVNSGNTNYKEFSIAGLISYLQDEQQLFTQEIIENGSKFRNATRQTGLNDIDYETLSTSLTSRNIQKERIFKLLVLDWLNDGKIKLFKSPTEGNYLVRLMNVNLSPNVTVGRMLHSFNCQALEIKTCNLENLQELGMCEGEISSAI